MIKPNPPVGFRLHLRHVAIPAFFVAILVNILTPVAWNLGAKGVLNPPLLLLLLAPWYLISGSDEMYSRLR